MSTRRPVPFRLARRTSSRMMAAALAAAVLPLATLPAHAAAPLRPGPYYERPTPYDDSGTFDSGCKGLDVEVHFEAHGVFSTRRVLGSGGQAFLAKNKFTFEEVWTDLSAGRVLFTVTGRYVIEEIDVRRVRESTIPRRLVPKQGLKGPVFEFTETQTGGDVARDEAGALVYWNAGQLTFTNLFDTLGDREPGGRSLRFRLVKSVGHHPLVRRDICDVAAEQAAIP